jgi:hypothetical protein
MLHGAPRIRETDRSTERGLTATQWSTKRQEPTSAFRGKTEMFFFAAQNKRNANANDARPQASQATTNYSLIKSAVAEIYRRLTSKFPNSRPRSRRY